MKRNLVSLASGILFGAGLAVSGMMNPARVRGFLDIFGNWDATLAFVMGGALVVMAIAWRLVSRMSNPVCCDEFNLPGTKKIDGKLIAGSVLFGVGWGLAGLCPGPAIGSLATVPGPASLFVAAMLSGMVLFRLYERVTDRHV